MAFRRGFKTEANEITAEVRTELGLSLYDALDPHALAQWLEIPIVGLTAFVEEAPAVSHLLHIGSDEWKHLYRGRSAVEREFGRLKNEYALAPLRTRGLARVRLHADLVMLGRLGQVLVRARAIPVAALASIGS